MVKDANETTIKVATDDAVDGSDGDVRGEKRKRETRRKKAAPGETRVAQAESKERLRLPAYCKRYFTEVETAVQVFFKLF